MSEDQLFVRIKKAAIMLGVGTATLRRWNREGVLPITKLGGRVLGYHRDTLNAFAEGRKVPKKGGAR